MADEEKTAVEVGFLSGIIQEIIGSPLNLALVAIITFLVFKIFKSQQPPKPSPPSAPELPKLRRDFTVAELKAYDGNQPDGRVLVAVNGTVYDVTRGKRFYGPGELTRCNGAAPSTFWYFKVPIDFTFAHSVFYLYCQFYSSYSSLSKLHDLIVQLSIPVCCLNSSVNVHESFSP